MKRRIGILTSGGDCPGLNAAIRGVARAAYEMFDAEIVGIHDGYRGLIEADGGINRSNIRALAEAGLDIAVMGTTVFTSRNLKQDLAEMHAVGRGDLDA